jgi:hypothetical protein
MLNNNDEVTPIKFFLSQNYPNPFSEKTVIKYCVAYKTRVRIAVYNSEGEEIEKLVDEEKEAGTYEVVFQTATRLPDGQVGNRQLANGNYFYRIEAGEYKSEKRMQLII